VAGVRITQLRPQQATGRRYGSFAGRPPAAVNHPVGRITQLHPQHATGGRYGSFAGRPAGGVPVVVTTRPSGVKKRPVVVRLSDVENRADTAEFLKSQLRLRHPDSAFVPQPARESRADRLLRERTAAQTARAMAIEAEEETRRILVDQNNAILTLLLIGSK
jgi:hypothetical protein